MAQAQPQSHGVNRPNPLGPYNPIKKHSEPERYVSIKINQNFSMTTKQVKLNFGFIKQLCKRATGLVHTNFFSYFNPITGRSEHIDQRDSGDFHYPLLLADTSNK